MTVPVTLIREHLNVEDNRDEGLLTHYAKVAMVWVKDCEGRALSFDDVKHYQRILKILAETDRIMQTVTMSLDA